MSSIQAEDKGTYICAIKQPRGSKPSSKKSRRINVIVVGRRSEKLLNLDVLREAARVFRESKISNEKSNFFLFYQNTPFCELVLKKIF